MLMDDERKPMRFTCKKCGVSMDDEETVWIVDVRWPTKIKVNKEGEIAYMLAELDDNDVLDRLDLSVVICDACKSNDVEVKEWETEEPWMKSARDKKEAEEKAAEANEDVAEPEDKTDE